MSVRFKFKNDLDYQPIPCDGFHISVRDLKRSIIRLKKFGKITDFDLVVTNSQSGIVYKVEEELIPKNTTLTVQRAPLGEGKKKVNITVFPRNISPGIIFFFLQTCFKLFKLNVVVSLHKKNGFGTF